VAFNLISSGGANQAENKCRNLKNSADERLRFLCRCVRGVKHLREVIRNEMMELQTELRGLCVKFIRKSCFISDTRLTEVVAVKERVPSQGR